MTSPTTEELWTAACKVREHAYAPYSGYQVGAALRVRNSERIFTGCNVENASYGATICAERSAVVQAVADSEGAPEIEELVLVTHAPAVPCGNCLQVLAEFCSPGSLISTSTPDDLMPPRPFSEFLPLPFSPDSFQHHA
jgi:homotetrameric cytidine deaminase